jgi:hypothetical protein
MESTTTSLAAVDSEPSVIAATAPAGELTTVASAAHDAAPVYGARGVNGLSVGGDGTRGHGRRAILLVRGAQHSRRGP